MHEIKIDSQRLRNAASELRGDMSAMKDRLSEFRDIQSEIEASWKSRYTRQYLDCLEDTENQIRRTVNSVEAVASNLDKIAASADRVEREIKASISRLRGGGG